MNPSTIAVQDLIALTLTPGAGRQTIRHAVQMAVRSSVSLTSCFGASVKTLLKQAAPTEASAVQALSACGEQEQSAAKAILGLCHQAGIRYWTYLDPNYPGFLANALGNQAPVLLFYQGNEALLHAEGAGIVGTRRPTSEAAEWARATAQFFAGEGITVVSGGAAGIDSEAHEAAMKADGTTVVIVPEGLHTYHPPTAIRRGLQNGQALLLSEFLPSSAWQTHRAMTRNRTIAASSSTICLLEPRAEGGSMFTAEQALRMGKSVFYWGGACRDGALHGRHHAFPLVRAGKLERAALLQAATQTANQAAQQFDLFGE